MEDGSICLLRVVKVFTVRVFQPTDMSPSSLLQFEVRVSYGMICCVRNVFIFCTWSCGDL